MVKSEKKVADRLLANLYTSVITSRPLRDQYKKYSRVRQVRETLDEPTIMWRHVHAIYIFGDLRKEYKHTIVINIFIDFVLLD
jgi:hypothetical protein